jgi:hypothetical protein
MQNNDRNSNTTMPDRLYGEHYPDSFLYVSGSIRDTNVSTLGDYIRHLQEVNKQPDQPSVPSQPIESNFEHICPNNPILTCNCSDPNACAELGSDPDNGNRVCPDSGKLCHTDTCADKCLGDGFADNINYTGIPPTKGESKVSGWPCVVIGAVCEARDNSTECISRSPDSSGFAK